MAGSGAARIAHARGAARTRRRRRTARAGSADGNDPMRAMTWTAAIMSLAIAVIAHADQTAPPRDSAGTSRSGAAIVGTVVADDAEARPVRAARVALRGTGSTPDRQTQTDDRGRFAFQGLPPGRFALAASKAGWITVAYGARRPLRPGTTVALGDGQTLDVTMRIAHGAVITGQVLDHTG